MAVQSIQLEEEHEGGEAVPDIHPQKLNSSISFQTAVSGTSLCLSTGTCISGGYATGAQSNVGLPEKCHPHQRTNLNYYHSAARFSGFHVPGHFTMVRCLNECVRPSGKIELYRWQRLRQQSRTGSEQSVVVKRVPIARVFENVQREACEKEVHFDRQARFAEDTLNEIGIYSYLSQQQDLPEYLLRMHTAFQTTDDVWLVLEHADGGDLFHVVQSMGEGQDGNFTSPDALERSRLWTWQLLQAVDYLHRHCIGHRDISIENVLLCRGSIRLMDFGQSVQTHSSTGELLRYFCALGKPHYRPPECNIPQTANIEVVLTADTVAGEPVFVKTADGRHICHVILSESGLAGQSCMAQSWGYALPPVDIFASSVCLWLMTTGLPPWREATFQDDHFKWVHANGIQKLLRGWGQSLPDELMDLLVRMMNFNPAQRPTARDCLGHAWFKDLHGKPVPVHVTDSLDSSVDAGIASTTLEAKGPIQVTEVCLPSAASSTDFTALEEEHASMQYMPSIAEMQFTAETGFYNDPYAMGDTQRCAPDLCTGTSEPDTFQLSTSEFGSPRAPRDAKLTTAAAAFPKLSPKKPAYSPTRRSHGLGVAGHRRLSTSSTGSKRLVVLPSSFQSATHIAAPPDESSWSSVGCHSRNLSSARQKVSASSNPRRHSMPRRRPPVGSAVNAAKSKFQSLEEEKDGDFLAA